MYEIVDKSEKFYKIVCKEAKNLDLIYNQLSKFPDRYSINSNETEVTFYKSIVNYEFILNELDIYLFKNEEYYKIYNSLGDINSNELDEFNIKPNEFVFKTKPWEHQRQAFLKSCYKEKYALFMEQRTGKTKVALDTAAYLYENKKIEMVVIVAPNIVHNDWIEEGCKTHLKSDYISFVWSSSKNKIEPEEVSHYFFDKSKLFVFSINREAINTVNGGEVLRYLLRYYKCLLIVDESHNFKNPHAKSTGALLVMAKRVKYVRILSGTPIGNSLVDLYSQLKLLDEKILGYSSFSSFRRFCEDYPAKAKEYIYDKIKKYFIRVTLRECFKDIPPMMDIVIKYKMTDKQKSIYEEIIKNNFIMDSKDTTLFKNIIIKLQQVVSGYYIDTEGTEIEVVDGKKNPKIIALNELIEKIEGKIIIWTKFKKEVKDVAKNLDSRYKYVIYTGEQSNEEKLFAKTQFKTNPDVKIIIINIQSGAEGLTLPEADTSIYYSNTYSFLKRDQSEKRFITGDNNNPKTCYNLCSIGTLDSRILYLLKKKKQLSKEMIDRVETTPDELKHLIIGTENEESK